MKELIPTNLAVAEHAATHHSMTSTAFFFATLVSLAITLVPTFSKKREQSKRPLFWGAVGATSLCSFMISAPNWKQSIVVGAFFFLALTATAYMYTDNIKFRGRVYTYYRPANAQQQTTSDANTSTLTQGGPDVYPSLVTPPKLWWTIVVVMLICAINVYSYLSDHHGPRPALVSAVAVLVVAAASGYTDSYRGYDIARGQRAQLVIVGLITVGVFPAIYLIAHYIGNFTRRGTTKDG